MGGAVQKSSQGWLIQSSKNSSKTGNDVNINREIFFTRYSRILSSSFEKKVHPELRLLRTILRCDFGRPKLIQFLLRQTSVLKYQTLELYGDRSWPSSNFTKQFLCSQSLSCIPSSLPDEKSLCSNTEDEQDQLPQIVLLAAISNYHKFSESEEHMQWIQYQYMLNENNNSSYQSESLRSVSRFSSSQLTEAILDSNYEKVLNKSHWIVALADVLQDASFPAFIFKKDTSMIHFANSAFVDMVGDSREEIAQHPHNIYHSLSADSSSPLTCDPAIAYAINNGTSIKIGTMYHPQSPLTPFMNLQSYLPLYDSEGHCNYFLVLHCDIWKHHQNPEYLQKLDIFTELLSKAIIPHRDHEDIFLKAYFYDKIQSNATLSL
jgi:hypothetical protein